MLGAIIGDIVGSRFEFHNFRSKWFSLFHPSCTFTDDTILTLAVASAIKRYKTSRERGLYELAQSEMRILAKAYPNASFGVNFREWLSDPEPQPYNSYGNGAAMRVSACAELASSLEEAKYYAEEVTRVTHNHPEGMKAAECVTHLVWEAMCGASKKRLEDIAIGYYGPFTYAYQDLLKNNKFSECASETVPQAIFCFLQSNGFEDALRTAVSIGGDTDTICAITGSIAEHYYGIPTWMKRETMRYLDNRLTTILKSLLLYEMREIGV
uniref:ADP-ribosylglycohydrolase family protein n=1 Tax=uncultured Flavonifractor sp. TaxID=1193534 RepID=UPI00262657BF|nr:ADP-ribosylglycohydrolase family protein [uncultured Flavonifractor sp.]